MRLEDQIVSLELAKRLKDLGVKQDSYFYWVKVIIPDTTYSTQSSVKEWPEYFLISKELKHNVYLYVPSTKDNQLSIYSYGCGCCGWEMEVAEIYSAFTVAELGELLPKKIVNNGFDYFITLCRPKIDFEKWMIIYRGFNGSVDFFTMDEKESDARAKMLIYLLENKLIDLSKSPEIE